MGKSPGKCEKSRDWAHGEPEIQARVMINQVSRLQIQVSLEPNLKSRQARSPSKSGRSKPKFKVNRIQRTAEVMNKPQSLCPTAVWNLLLKAAVGRP